MINRRASITVLVLAVLLVVSLLSNLALWRQTPAGAKSWELTPQEKEQERADALDHARKAFDGKTALAYRDRPEEPLWASKLRGGLYRPFAEICTEEIRFYHMGVALSAIRDHTFLWAQVGISEDRAQTLYHTTGKILARSLLDVYKAPRTIRDQSPTCNQGEGTWSFASSVDIVDQVRQILVAIEAQPDEIRTPDELIGLVVKDLRPRLVNTRWLVQKNLGTYGAIRHDLQRAIADYRITPTQLGMTKEEARLASVWGN